MPRASNARVVDVLTLRALSFGLDLTADRRATVDRLLGLAGGSSVALEQARARVSVAMRERMSPTAARAHDVLVDALRATRVREFA